MEKEFQRWVCETFHVGIPIVAPEIVAHPPAWMPRSLRTPSGDGSRNIRFEAIPIANWAVL